jgi:hypothetical protein
MALDEVPDVLTNLYDDPCLGFGLELAKGLEPPTL